MLCDNRRKDLPKGWAYELKWDGTRAIIEVKSNKVRAWSRRGHEISGRYPELEELASHRDCVLDGEIIALNEEDRPDFQLLQRRSHVTSPFKAQMLAREIPITFIPFDVLSVYGISYKDLDYAARRLVLERLELGSDHVYVAPYSYDRDKMLAIAKQYHLEGLVAKWPRSRYNEGVRSPHWVKHKLRQCEEFVVTGYQYGEGSRAHKIGALFLSYRHKGELYDCGKVGSGFTDYELDRLKQKIDPWVYQHKGDAVFCTPKIVVEVEFQGWSNDERLRHPSYKGEREDKTVFELG